MNIANVTRACIQPWESANIAADGKVYPCCVVHKDLLIGDLAKSSLADILSGEAMTTLKRRLLRGDYQDLPCAGCCNAPLMAPADFKEMLSAAILPDALESGERSMNAWRVSTLSDSDVRKLVDGRHWHHRYEIVPGIFTPGTSEIEPARIVDTYGVPSDLTGLRALDIGTFDGPYAFELERRGATVTAIDIQPPDLTAFNTAKHILGSNVEYVQGSVYDLRELTSEPFDIIFYPGVYYHLKHPILALEAIASVLRPGGMLCFIGECLISYAEKLNGEVEAESWIRHAAESEVPLCLTYPGIYKGVSNWIIPNTAGMKSWLQATGFELERYDLWHVPDAAPYPHQRMSGVARRAGSAVSEHPLVGDAGELEAWVKPG